MKYPKLLKFIPFILFIALFSCKEEDSAVRIFEASFQTDAIGLASADESIDVTVNFSTPTIAETTVQIGVSENGVVYGNDYTATNYTDGTISVVVPVGSSSATFSITRLVEFINTGNSVELSLTAIDGEEDVDILGFTSLSVLFEEVVSSGGTIDLLTGGSTMPNQCYIDLSSYSQTAVRRDTWELAFYSGEENRVFLNSALLLSAVELIESTDIDAVNSETVFETPLSLSSYGEPVTVNNLSELLEGLPLSYYMYGNYTDNKEGTETAIRNISATDSENSIYVVSLGYEVPETPDGSLNTTGDQRGFYKIKVLLDGNDYKLQYAELDATTHKEVTIAKNAAYNNVFYSLTNETEAVVEPAKENWDINFSGVFSFNSGTFGVTYSDYALHNTLGETGLYEILTYTTDDGIVTGNDVPSYENFTASDIDEESFVYDDRAVIGSNWRDAFSSPAAIKDDRYYVVKDNDGNYFKLLFTGLTSDAGERGYGQFVYEAL